MAEDTPLKEYLKDRAARVDAALDDLLPRKTTRPGILHEAMRYSIFAGGKRLRPILCIAACEACGGEADDALLSACAVECIHTYSLVHDDLPCMDDDDFRRGLPTNHKKYGEALAVLAGDALQALAFEILAASEPRKNYSTSTFLGELAYASGSRRLIAGQVADIEAEGQERTTPEELSFIHKNKTAALLTTSIRLGAMHANAPESRLQTLTEFGEALGLAFQVIDDILDCTQTSEKLGKSAGKDVAAGKATYPAVFGIEQSREEAAKLTRQAGKSLESLGSKASRLSEIAQYLLDRDY